MLHFLFDEGKVEKSPHGEEHEFEPCGHSYPSLAEQ